MRLNDGSDAAHKAEASDEVSLLVSYLVLFCLQNSGLTLFTAVLQRVISLLHQHVTLLHIPTAQSTTESVYAAILYSFKIIADIGF